MTENKYFLMSETVKDLLFKNGKPKEDCFYSVNTCLVCNSKKLKKLFSQWGIDYLKCKECSFIFSNPRLTGKGAYLWYNSDYYNAAMKTEHYFAKKINKYYSVSLNQQHINKFIEIFKKQNLRKDVSIADLGCGSGTIIHYLRDEMDYSNVKGFDLNEENALFARQFRQLDLEMKDVYELEEKEKFDVIITTENIEHVSNPKEYVNQLKKLLKPHGLLFLTTPHNDKLSTTLMGLHGDHFCAPNHQNYFNLANLEKLLNSVYISLIDFWIDDKIKFDLLSFLKHFFYERDQVTAIPPNKAVFRGIKKNSTDRKDLVQISNIEVSTESTLINDNSNKSIKRSIKTLFQNLVPVYLKTHQIIVARND